MHYYNSRIFELLEAEKRERKHNQNLRMECSRDNIAIYDMEVTDDKKINLVD